MPYLIHYGALTVFLVMLLEQLGLPIPAAPVILAAGAMTATGQLRLSLILIVATVGALLGDVVWYELGRKRGAKILATICRISMEPDTCVRRTENTFVRYGVNILIASKFLPGFNRIAPPLAGIFKVSRPRFILYDGLGSLLYAVVFLALGALFRTQVDRLLEHLAFLGKWAGGVVGGFFALYLIFKYIQRRIVIRQLRIARITPEELQEKIKNGSPVAIFDLRSDLDLTSLPYLIPGAIHILPSMIESRFGEIPTDQDIVVYCSCPNEVTAARVAIMLRRRGIKRIRPLLGGITAWRYREYDLQPITPSL